MLRAMGAPVSSIQKIFIFQSGILGLLGALIGTFAGILIALTIGQYEIQPDSSDVYGSISFILLPCTLWILYSSFLPFFCLI